MANSLLSIDMVTKEAMRVAHEKLTFLGTIRRDYDDSFAKTGAKIGSALRVRKPNQFTRRSGSRVMAVQDNAESSVSVTMATQDGVDMRFNSAELALTIDDFSERYIKPAMAVLVSGIESDALATATKAVYNQVGTAGTVVGTTGDISAIFNARARLNQMLAPKDDNRTLQLDSVTMATVVNGVKGIFQPSGDISQAFREGFYTRTAMADIYENERTYTVAYGSDVTGTTDATGLSTANADGSYSVVDMHTTVATSAQTVGSTFTIAGIYACHPETKKSLGYLQQFVITATDSPSANLTTVSPTIYLSGAKQNVCDSAGAVLATTAFNSQTLTFGGSASTSYRQNLMYHKEFATFVTADLPLMDDAIKCVRMTQDGLSLRVWQGSDIRNDEQLMRLDILYGFQVLRPEWCVRITN